MPVLPPDNFPLETDYFSRCRLIVNQAEELIQSGYTWAEFFRSVFGPDGLVFRYFNTPEMRERFRMSDEYRRLAGWLKNLHRSGNGERRNESENVRVVTVRMPSSLHSYLIQEAHRRNTSLNQLCIGELLPKSELLSAETETPAAA